MSQAKAGALAFAGLLPDLIRYIASLAPNHRIGAFIHLSPWCSVSDRMEDFDVLQIPGAFCPWNMVMAGEPVEFLKRAYGAGKILASICHGAIPGRLRIWAKAGKSPAGRHARMPFSLICQHRGLQEYSGGHFSSMWSKDIKIPLLLGLFLALLGLNPLILQVHSQPLFPIRVGDLWGYMNSFGGPHPLSFGFSQEILHDPK